MIGKSFSLVLSFSLLVSGCVSYAPAIRDAKPLQAGEGVVYGRFKQLPAFNSLQLGLVLKSENTGKDYIIKFSKHRPLVAISVPPGNYSINKLICATGEGFKSHYIATSASLCFTVMPGHAYYVGDYLGETSSEVDGTFVNYKWSLVSKKNNFMESTKEMRSYYPFLDNTIIHDAFENADILSMEYVQ
ncbi:MAG TPA: hypothetical protein PKC67_04935 [Kiritimatiellia bacterium]|nr:hypothetical protein [Kiritimatiellia bacterium]HMP33677.1 hypothetical protein [Kiritimatiellia bacterium]